MSHHLEYNTYNESSPWKLKCSLGCHQNIRTMSLLAFYVNQGVNEQES